MLLKISSFNKNHSLMFMNKSGIKISLCLVSFLILGCEKSEQYRTGGPCAASYSANGVQGAPSYFTVRGAWGKCEGGKVWTDKGQKPVGTWGKGYGWQTCPICNGRGVNP
jgi:hypothetical protein